MDVPVNEGGIFNWDVLCAALLHDAIEDTQTTAEELTKAFGKNVASIVLEVTDDKALPKEERKLQQIAHAPHSSHEANSVGPRNISIQRSGHWVEKFKFK